MDSKSEIEMMKKRGFDYEVGHSKIGVFFRSFNLLDYQVTLILPMLSISAEYDLLSYNPDSIWVKQMGVTKAKRKQVPFFSFNRVFYYKITKRKVQSKLELKLTKKQAQEIADFVNNENFHIEIDKEVVEETF